MRLLDHLARAAALACLAASMPAAADYRSDYVEAWLGERLRHDRPQSYWSDLVSRPSKRAERGASGPSTWNPLDENPWANTYGTPMSNRWSDTIVRPLSSGVVRLCSCYLDANARSWDGAELTNADIARLCRAQCY